MSDPWTFTWGLEEISRESLDSSDAPEAIITDVKHLASYNWIEASETTIAIPGSPALWSASGPRKLKKDGGLLYSSQKSARVRRHYDSRLEPLFRALYIEQPLFKFNSIDVVTDRNSTLRLLTFINPAQSRDVLDPFTIRVDMTAGVAIFCREEPSSYDIIGPANWWGFGYEFEKAYTINQVENSTAHHRIISHRLGDLRFLVCYEADGYLGDSKPGEREVSSAGDNIAQNLRPSSLKPEITPTVQPPVDSKFIIKREGRIISRESTLEIKTRVSHKQIRLSEVAPQLWISQISNLVRAYHQDGMFSAPVVEDVTTALKRWEQANQDDIKELWTVIQRILQMTRSWGGTSVICYDAQREKLIVKKYFERKKMLPDDLYRRWSKTTPQS